ncbi:WbqC family protein [Achromobacter aloeverae]|uniref:WbqC family protein n=1 Tax=Achromobacter aloeverae TaxID=1750518 RepID=A0A4Q1HQB8_9BURK|nr:WbqC family protein [Achromobacter aloeverae]RXN92586.1 hypothetical protein C7R54_02180 [Achromobacter aloeverae]
MRLAIMQPYFLPYLGYWQLLVAADRFVIYDNVNYIKGGWVNRNRVLISGLPGYITVPLHQATPYKQIIETQVQAGTHWRDKMCKTLENCYRRAPYFAESFPVLERIIRHPEANLASYLSNQLSIVADHLDLPASIVLASDVHPMGTTTGEARVLEICAREGASHYVNSVGGMALYDTGTFRSHGIELQFLKSRGSPYPQRAKPFTPHLSIADVLMEVGKEGAQRLLREYDLITSPPLAH